MFLLRFGDFFFQEFDLSSDQLTIVHGGGSQFLFETLDPRFVSGDARLQRGLQIREFFLDRESKAVRLNPKRAIGHASKARVLAALHRYDEAISVYDSALGKNGPKSSTPIFVS